MGTVVFKIDLPAIGIEQTGEGSSPTDEQMQEEQQARDAFLGAIGPKLAALPERPPRRAGNVSRVELLGTDIWSEMNHYLLLVGVDIGDPDLGELESAMPAGTDMTRIGTYRSIQVWPEESSEAPAASS